MDGDPLVIGLLVGAIVAVTVVTAAVTIRRERGQQRGLEPGTGDHIIEVSYSSGVGGGGHITQIRVPRDPQAYARRFVPKGAEMPDTPAGEDTGITTKKERARP